MLSPRLSLFFVFCLSFLITGSVGHSRHPPWARLFGEWDPQDTKRPDTGMKSQNYYPPYHLGQLWSLFEHLNIIVKVGVLSLLCSIFLTVINLWRRVRRCHREERRQILSAAPGTCCQNRSCKYCMLLRQLKTNPELKALYLQHVRNRYQQKDAPAVEEIEKLSEDDVMVL